MSSKALGKSFRRIPALLIISIFLSIFQSVAFAKNLDQSAEDYRLKGYGEQKKGNFDLALTYYTKALGLGLEDAVLYNDIGVICEYLGKPVDAEKSYRKATELNPKYLPPYTNLAYLFKGQGRSAEAAQYFEKRYWYAPDGDPWKNRALEEVLQLNPRFRDEIIKREADQLKSELVAKAKEEFYLQLLRSERHSRQGEQFAAEKKYKQAIAEFDRALSLTPDNPKIIKAKKDAEFALDIDDIKHRAGKAIEKLDAGELETARKQFQEILATIPDESNPSSGK